MPLALMSKVTSIWGALAGRWGDPGQVELPNRLLSLVIACSPSYTCTSTLLWLFEVVKVCPLGGDGGVPFDERGHDATSRLDAQGQRGHVE